MAWQFKGSTRTEQVTTKWTYWFDTESEASAFVAGLDLGMPDDDDGPVWTSDTKEILVNGEPMWSVLVTRTEDETHN